MKMLWGKHKGDDIEDIPSDYLKWLAENCDGTIAEAADKEYQFRSDQNKHVYE